jgi:hypothetical protein
LIAGWIFDRFSRSASPDGIILVCFYTLFVKGHLMNARIKALLAQIRQLEMELREEIQKIRIDTYEIRDNVIRFKSEIASRHRGQMTGLLKYLREARLKHVLTAPIIWLCLMPTIFMDIIVSLYQTVCFPIYGIPKVKRADYVVIDHHYLQYLNIIEKLNCVYCGYFNGVIAYVREIGARTEQYWCPIKHAQQLKDPHPRYVKFFEYGDSDQFIKEADKLREDFEDLKQAATEPENRPPKGQD